MKKTHSASCTCPTYPILSVWVFRPILKIFLLGEMVGKRMYFVFTEITTYGVGDGIEVGHDDRLVLQDLLHRLEQAEEDSEHLLLGESDRVFSCWILADIQVMGL